MFNIIITKCFLGARIHDGFDMHEDHAFVVHADGSRKIVARASVPEGCAVESLAGGIIAPGYVDVQINGGGGVMFNDDQSVDSLRQIAAAHASIGSAAVLPTLIADTPVRTKAAIDAV